MARLRCFRQHVLPVETDAASHGAMLSTPAAKPGEFVDISTLLDNAAKACGAKSDRDLARRLDVSHTAIGQWRNGERHPTFEAAAKLAELAGLPITATAASVRLHTPEGQKYRALLRRLSAAAAICLAVYTAICPNVTSANGGQNAALHKSTLYTLHTYLVCAHSRDITIICSASGGRFRACTV